MSKKKKKNIRFPHEIIEAIEICMESERATNPNINFSAWVLDACEKKLKKERRRSANSV
ncbi:YlcI/YnfO family protein [Erwinia tracheiphila]